MEINDFKLERYFSRYEFNTEYLLSPSDCESFTMNEILDLAGKRGRELWQELDLGYKETQGSFYLREEISNLYENIEPEEVLVIAPSEGIFIALNAILNEGDHIIAIAPAYQSLSEIPLSLDCRVTEWPVILNDGEWELRPERLEEYITEETRMVIVNFPHNPTGFLPKQETFARLLEIVERNNLWLFSDEMYKYSEYDPEQRLASPGDNYLRGVSLGGLSKSFGLPGLRIGWLVTKNEELLTEFMKIRDYTTLCCSAPAEVLAAIALSSREEILQRNLDIIRSNLRLAADFFIHYDDIFRWLPPQAGPIAFPRLKIDISIDEFCRDLIEQKDVMLLPGSVFAVEGKHFRLGMGRKNFGEGLKRFADYVEVNFG